jgi:hypothetical protein
VTTRIDLFNKFMTLQMEGRLEAAVAMLADDVILTDPMTGTSTGKPAVEATMRSRPPGGGDMGITWSEPEIEGDSVKLVGTGSPFPVLVVVSFDTDDKINRIDISLS